MIVGKQFTFEAAHTIVGHPTCGRIHGHTWTLDVILRGEPDDSGMVVDFHLFGGWVKHLINFNLDHKMLNETVPLPVLTCETLCEWLVTTLIDLGPTFLGKSWDNISYVTCRLQEGPGGWAEVSMPTDGGPF